MNWVGLRDLGEGKQVIIDSVNFESVPHLVTFGSWRCFILVVCFLNYEIVFECDIFNIRIEWGVKAESSAECLNLLAVEQRLDTLVLEHHLEVIEELVPLILVAKEVEIGEEDRALFWLRNQASTGDKAVSVSVRMAALVQISEWQLANQI